MRMTTNEIYQVLEGTQPIEVQREEKKQNNNNKKETTLVIWSSPSEVDVDRSVALSSEPTPKSPELNIFAGVDA